MTHSLTQETDDRAPAPRRSCLHSLSASSHTRQWFRACISTLCHDVMYIILCHGGLVTHLRTMRNESETNVIVHRCGERWGPATDCLFTVPNASGAPISTVHDLSFFQEGTEGVARVSSVRLCRRRDCERWARATSWWCCPLCLPWRKEDFSCVVASLQPHYYECAAACVVALPHGLRRAPLPPPPPPSLCHRPQFSPTSTILSRTRVETPQHQMRCTCLVRYCPTSGT